MAKNSDGCNWERGPQARMAKLEEEMKRFLKANPSIAEAMRLFRISSDDYERAVAAMYEPRLESSDSTSGGSHGNQMERDK